MGSWAAWNGQTFENLHMVYWEGDTCSNELNQELIVYVQYGKKSRIILVRETSQCKLYMVFETKLVCEQYNLDAEK
ncbi:unnamed protein product [Adineta steineri]|uniref:Glucosidase 2 subunit beta-like domain-containing protein n=1 Tax=Adineta steineri TaxID=433720 RepID=A0A815XZH0_9BILA|nr:unnamed protein product [Adineta steineri]CAF1563710.1 unnamed protein product [Adineta steineri]